MRRLLIWLCAAIFGVGLTVVIWCPAAWIAPFIEQQTGARITLGEVQGSIWRGSAFVGGAASARDAVTPLLPGRFAWRLSPLVLLGMVDVQLDNPDALSQPVSISGSWSQWQVSPAAIRMPAQRLIALGAPLNTIVPSGEMQLVWNTLQVTKQDREFDLTGSMRLELNDIGARLSQVKPLGAYRLQMEWQGQKARLQLKTVHGPLLLSGSGGVDHGRVRFSGRAQAAPGQEERLAGLLNLLGQRQREGGLNYIALELK